MLVICNQLKKRSLSLPHSALHTLRILCSKWPLCQGENLVYHHQNQISSFRQAHIFVRKQSWTSSRIDHISRNQKEVTSGKTSKKKRLWSFEGRRRIKTLTEMSTYVRARTGKIILRNYNYSSQNNKEYSALFIKELTYYPKYQLS